MSELVTQIEEKMISIEKEQEKEESLSLWQHAFKKLLSDKMAIISFSIFAIYVLVAVLSFCGIIANDWNVDVGSSYLPPSSKYFFGTDLLGRDVFLKTIKGAEVAVTVGLVTALIATLIGVTLGAIAGYFGGIVDEVIVWFYTSFSSIPYILMLVALSFIIGQKGLVVVFLALGLSSWVNLCRLVRGEVIRHRDREYVQAAHAIGCGHMRKLFVHILPNIGHIIIINFSLQFQYAIKAEVILSYLGIGVQELPSWGKMIDDAKQELFNGVWWQLVAATAAMFIVVLSLNILGDSLRDALDPKLKGK